MFLLRAKPTQSPICFLILNTSCEVLPGQSVFPKIYELKLLYHLAVDFFDWLEA